MTGLDRLLTTAGNFLLDWTLHLPRDLTLLLLATLMIALLLGLRSVVSDRDALRVLAADERRLAQLRAAARARSDRVALQQHRRVRRLLAGRRARLEIVPALAGLLPALLLLHWGARRLEYRPLRENDPIEITATFPVPAIGRTAHLVPQPSLSVEPTWIRVIAAAAEDGTRGESDWRVTATSPGEILLTLRHPEGSVEIPLEVGTRRYAPPVMEHAGDVVTEVKLQRYQPLGIVPPLPWLGLSAWMVGLLLLTIPGYLSARRLLRLA